MVLQMCTAWVAWRRGSVFFNATGLQWCMSCSISIALVYAGMQVPKVQLQLFHHGLYALMYRS